MTNSNGTPGGEGTAVTFALDEGYQFGLGVFETINLTGGRLVMLDRHLDRLRRGARALDIDAPDDDTLRAHIAEHLDAAELPDGRSFAVKLMVSSANVIVTHRPNPYADWAQDRGLRLGWCRAWRNECSPLTAHKTLNQGDNSTRIAFGSAARLRFRRVPQHARRHLRDHQREPVLRARRAAVHAGRAMRAATRHRAGVAVRTIRGRAGDLPTGFAGQLG